MSSRIGELLDLSRRVFKDTSRIGGWLSFDAVFATALLTATQGRFLGTDAAISTLEIGVHHGKYFVAFNSLYAHLYPGTALVSTAVDLFAAQESNVDLSGKGDKDIFLRNLRTWLGGRCDTRVVEGDSMKLRAADLPDQRGLYFASIDGGHHYECVRHDVGLAGAAMKEGGLVSVDDFYNPGWVEVSTALIGNLDGTLHPLVLCGNKLFLVKDSSADQRLYNSWLATLCGELDIPGMHSVDSRRVGDHLVETKLQPFLGRRLVYLVTYDLRPHVRVLRRTLRKIQF